MGMGTVVARDMEKDNDTARKGGFYLPYAGI
jgi:hypothetical protein